MNLKIFLFPALFFGCFMTSLAQTVIPPDTGCLVFIGQDLHAVGGLEDYQNGYVDHFKTPAGITIYTNLSPGNNSFGYINQGLDGLLFKANWGAGDSWGEAYLNDSTFNQCIISIGLSFVNNEQKVAEGDHDSLIIKLASWIKKADRPVLLRIGYEFDGHQWNNYNRKCYLKAWRRISDILKKEGVKNVSLVWQSKGYGSNQKELEKWYPGDELVDWVGYSYFGNPDTEMLTFARNHNKPVFIAEATPVRQIDNLYFNADLAQPEIAKIVWTDWFEGFFNTIEKNKDVIKAFSYINADWASEPMWIYNETFNKVDSRLQINEYTKAKWIKKMNNPYFIEAGGWKVE